MPLTVLWAAALVALTLTLGFPTCKSLLQPGVSRRVTLWWLGLSVASVLALLAKWMLLTMPFPRYADYLPPEAVSPLRQAILDNASALYWGASWTAVITTIAGALILPVVLQKLRTSQRPAEIYASRGQPEFDRWPR